MNSVAFSPKGEYLLSGSLDKAVHYWSLKEHKIVKTCTSKGGIFEVFWYKQGDKDSWPLSLITLWACSYGLLKTPTHGPQ